MSQEIVLVNSFLRGYHEYVTEWEPRLGDFYTNLRIKKTGKVIVNGKLLKRVGVELALRFLVSISLKVTVFLVGCNGNWKREI